MIEVIIIPDDGEVAFFSSVDMAARWLEPQSVDADLRVFGSEGELYRAWHDDRRVFLALDTLKRRPEELRTLLLRFLTRVRKPGGAEETLDALLQRCEPYCSE